MSMGDLFESSNVSRDNVIREIGRSGSDISILKRNTHVIVCNGENDNKHVNHNKHDTTTTTTNNNNNDVIINNTNDNHHHTKASISAAC